MSDAEQPVTLWGPPPQTKPVKPRQASLWDVAIGYLGIIFIPSLILTPLAIYLATRDSDTADPQALSGAAENILTSSGPLIVMALLLQWSILLFAVWRGGRKTEGGWRALVKWGFNWRQDLSIAALFTIVFVVLQVVVAFVLGLFGIDVSKLGNTNIVTSMQGVWLVVMAASAIIGAPIVEELFFRGLFFNVARRKWGIWAGVIVSSLFFGFLHFQPSLAATIYTVTSTAIVGAALAGVYARTDRLGTPLTAHVAFNATGVMLALLTGI